MSSPEETDPQEGIAELEHAAEAVRDRLASTLSRLDDKRRAVADVVEHPEELVERSAEALAEHPRELWIAAAVVAGAVGATVAWGVYRARTRRRRAMQHRMEAAVRAWRHPERLARGEPGLLQGLVRRLLTAAVTTAASGLVHRTLQPAPRRLPRPAARV
ncbi:MAG: hypothetical protein WKG00_29525 [Polyangiaceae bacterium]